MVGGEKGGSTHCEHDRVLVGGGAEKASSSIWRQMGYEVCEEGSDC